MLDNFNPTKAEREAIEGAYRWITENTRDEYRSNDYLKQERNGYGKPNDKIPLVAAKGNCVKWFLDGVQAPDVPLRDCYYCRPAALWFQGMGAARSGNAAVNMPALTAAVAAYNAAFQRMG